MPEAPLPEKIRTGGRIIFNHLPYQPETLTDILYYASAEDWENDLGPSESESETDIEDSDG